MAPTALSNYKVLISTETTDTSTVTTPDLAKNHTLDLMLSLSLRLKPSELSLTKTGMKLNLFIISTLMDLCTSGLTTVLRRINFTR